MKYVGLRRWFPNLSRAIRGWLIACAKYDRAFERATPEERAEMLYQRSFTLGQPW